MGTAPSKPDPSYSEKEQQAAADAAATSALFNRLHLSSTPVKASEPDISLAGVAQWRTDFAADDKARLANTLLSKADLGTALVRSDAVNADQMVFNLQLSSTTTPVTNQKSSGRCWLFATCNVIRTGIAKKFNLGDFELSQSYLFFYDSLEKANYFLEQSIDLSNKSLDSRLVSHLSTSPENDGGQWDMVVNLIEKYGLVPKSIYPESYHSSNTGRLDQFLTSKLRDYALELRSVCAETEHVMGKEDPKKARKLAIARARSAKSEMMAKIYRVLAIALGQPPAVDATFTWDYNDKTGKAHSLTCTPLEFYHEHCAGFKASEYISLINDPRNPYEKLYTVDRLGNVWGGRPVLYVNTTSKVLKETIVKMLKADKPVWFGCDVGKMSNSQLGIMDVDLMAYNDAFGVDIKMSKAERLQMQDSSMTHAMVITAAHLDENGEIVRCKVENSWSDTAGDHGYFVMGSSWIDEYVYQIVIPRSVAPNKLRKIFEGDERTVLPAWDPMGSLA